MSEGLPRPSEPFAGRIGRLLGDSEPQRLDLPAGPTDAPNVLLVMLDDVGFGSFASFGGPVQARAFEGVADRGLLYNQFHTTALCSPTRAALLTGRQHHAVHMGGITEIANSFPGYDSVIPAEAATVAQILQMSGYATSCFGKWHLTPAWEQGPAGPFNRWPTGMGFDRFYGIIGAEASQWEPAVYDQTTPISPHVGKPSYHLTEDLADQAVAWIERHRVSAPNRPWFCYFSTPAVHAPHHAPRDWIEQFRGKFDGGWDDLRNRIHEEQLRLGVIPEDTALTPRPDEIPAWADYPERYRPVAARLMECFAGFLSHTDHHIGRVIDAARQEGRETLVIYLSGDNGASAEGTIHGAWSAPSFQNGVHEDPEWLLDHMDDFGSAKCENHFNVGWAWALDSPFQWMKQVASHFGGTRNGLAVEWPGKITDQGGLRSQFHHVIDIAPTILEAAGITAPETVNGIKQIPLHGTPMGYSFAADGSSSRVTQYFEILGNRAIYNDGWIASCFHGRVPWIRMQAFDFDGPQERWELYDVKNDFSQSVDLSDKHPELLEELVNLFDVEARKFGVYPLRDAGSPRRGQLAVPHALSGLNSMTYSTTHVRLPESTVVRLKNCSWRISAEIALTVGDRGVIACQGGNMSGWSMWLDEGQPHFTYNCFGHEITTLSGPTLEPGLHLVEALFDYDGGFGRGGELVLVLDERAVAHARLDRTVPIVFSMSGETFDVGTDTGSPVGPYPHDFECSANIVGVTLSRLDEPGEAIQAAELEGLFRAGLSSQ
ncbi:MAG: arylsulfatase [Actinomycetota bacterium]|nr:arylsulfatase [Actinomycetota bacterium]MEE3139854.1 arylsulfatase [Actinomycetota bacterium]|tara:strand:+ start:30042 stop:32357 length:2316 start_codon:yes stop_codon:yes gene_type:complete